uniref:Uncharacterized protein n=1 Tax=CrAss-like virus sp. ctjK323 TaxID=2825839 RepID=A0A8S5Q1A4_9CAUD|nr:MAG TPA: hypothetical protein [CrAss-like virus sp. ctjK323]
MEKRISFDQFQSVKRVAQACNPLMVKREKIKAKIEALNKEYNDYDTQIASLEAGIKQVVGFRVEELVKKVIESGVDVNGRPKKTTKYLPTDIVSYDENKKQFIVSIPDNDPEDAETNSFSGEETATPSEENNLETSTEELDTNTEAENEDTQTVEAERVPTDAPIFE